jgi:hypothetical protein
MTTELIHHTLKNISTDDGSLKDAYIAIAQNLNSQTTYRTGLEALVICAETALKVCIV